MRRELLEGRSDDRKLTLVPIQEVEKAAGAIREGHFKSFSAGPGKD
jgi:hypothetical protein